MAISTLIDLTLNEGKDSSQHYITLFALILSLKAKNVLELGVRNGNTTKPFLLGLDYVKGNLTSVDIEDNPYLRNKLKDFTNWNFIVSDSIKFLESVKPGTIYDLVFVDDWHDGLHVKKQLELIEKMITPSSLVVLHDCMCLNTQPNYHYYQDKEGEFANGGPWRAIKELDKSVWEYVTIPVNNGLTILRKLGEELVF
jgi:predicted O-methyltransferase YrrM